MALNWLTFFRSYGVDYVTQGPNISRGNVGIACPFCGNDPSHHMGVSLSGRGWGCWRNSSHRGRNPIRLVMALLHCSYEAAQGLVDQAEGGKESVLDGSVLARVKEALIRDEVEQPASSLRIPSDFVPINDDSRGPNYGARYLISERGYRQKDLDALFDVYNIWYAHSGPFKARVIFTVWDERGLIGWTGRTVSSSALVRYKALTNDAEKAQTQGVAPAPSPISDTLWNSRLAFESPRKTLVVCEGPLDALRVDLYSSTARAVCVFGTGNVSPRQVAILSELRKKYSEIVILFDRDAGVQAFSKTQSLAHLGARVVTLPPPYDDPGELPRSEVRRLFS